MKLCIIGDTHYGYNAQHNQSLIHMLGMIKEESPDYIIHCGDVQSSSIYEAEVFWKYVRHILGWDVRIGCVIGNHDFWMEESVHDAIKHHTDLMATFGIDDLTRSYGVDIDKKLIIFGLTGWYHNQYVVTNDAVMIGGYKERGKDILRHSADVAFSVALRQIKDYVNTHPHRLLVTHFEFIGGENDIASLNYMGENPRWEKFIGDFTHIISGHRHLPSKDFSCGPEGKQLYYNCGSHYNDPRYLILNL